MMDTFMDGVLAWKQETDCPFCPVLASLTFNCP